MILSNEPGYYKAGAYGIRIENLVLVVGAGGEIAGREKDLNGFETLTLAPIDLRLVVPGMLSDGEARWLDSYHARVRDTLAPLVDEAARDWLAAATRPVGRP
jgi:Xaa-Pro aminopeptidase